MKKMTRSNYVRTGRRRPFGSDRVFNVFLVVLICVFLAMWLYPIIFIVSSSLSSGDAVSNGRVVLWPVDFDLMGYRTVLGHRLVWSGYKNTLLYTLAGTLENMILTILAAYPLSRKRFQLRKFYTFYLILIPMFFGGGLIPTYIQMSNMHLTNSRVGMILMAGIGVMNVVIMRTFFENNIPEELLEAAKMDGITDMAYLVKIVLPLSKAVLAVITLYYMVGHWNSYFGPMIYLRKQEYYPLQIILRQILNASSIQASDVNIDPVVAAQIAKQVDVIKYALVVVATLPMLILYPFVQKFFEKGVMIGSLKG